MECQRCHRPARPGKSENSEARPFRRASEGLCANCVVTQFFMEFPPFQIGVKEHGLKQVLGFKPMRDQFVLVLQAGNSELKPEEIDWAIIEQNWELPFPPARPNPRVKRTGAPRARKSTSA